MSKSSEEEECVKVIVRCRPMSEKEIADAQQQQNIDIDTEMGIIEVHNKTGDTTDVLKTFTFDAVYDMNSKQEELYEKTLRHLIESVLHGYNGTIFVYGQTGSGKTYTMQGEKSPELRGIIPRSFEHIFQHISRSEDRKFLVRASYLEIYQDEIRDLLSADQSRKLRVREGPETGVYVDDLTSVVTTNLEEIKQVLDVGNAHRSIGRANIDQHTSRSDAMFTITIEICDLEEESETRIRVGKLTLVDLTGSERQAKTGVAAGELNEATKIAQSLSPLGSVISALTDDKSRHIPYRNSKLTRLLQDSLGGSAKTVMVACIDPVSYDENLSTLRCAKRIQSIKNRPKINATETNRENVFKGNSGDPGTDN